MHQNKNHPIGGWVYKFYQLKPVIFWGGSLNHQGSRHLVSLTIIVFLYGGCDIEVLYGTGLDIAF